MKFTPARPTRTTTSPGPGSGAAISTTRSSSGPPNRATEIAAQAETLLWSVDPDASDWLFELYERA